MRSYSPAHSQLVAHLGQHCSACLLGRATLRLSRCLSCARNGMAGNYRRPVSKPSPPAAGNLNSTQKPNDSFEVGDAALSFQHTLLCSRWPWSLYMDPPRLGTPSSEASQRGTLTMGTVSPARPQRPACRINFLENATIAGSILRQSRT